MHFGFLLQLVTCSFLSVEGGLTHIQEFTQLSNNVGMFYPKNKFQALIPIDPPAHLDATSTYLFNFCKSP